MTIQEINEMILEDVIEHIKWRLLSFEQREQIRNEELIFEEIVFDQAALDAELEVYREELRIAEQARLDEAARVQNIKDRWEALGDDRLAVHKAGYSMPNLAIELKRIIEENDVIRLAEYEAKVPEIEAEALVEKAKEDKKKLAIDKMKLEKGKDRTLSQLNKAFDALLEALGY